MKPSCILGERISDGGFFKGVSPRDGYSVDSRKGAHRRIITVNRSLPTETWFFPELLLNLLQGFALGLDEVVLSKIQSEHGGEREQEEVDVHSDITGTNCEQSGVENGGKRGDDCRDGRGPGFDVGRQNLPLIERRDGPDAEAK